MFEIVQEIAVERMRGPGNDGRCACDAELFLGAFDPPCELDVWVGYDLGDFRSADVGGGDDEWERRVGGGGEELAVDVGADLGEGGVCIDG